MPEGETLITLQYPSVQQTQSFEKQNSTTEVKEIDLQVIKPINNHLSSDDQLPHLNETTYEKTKTRLPPKTTRCQFLWGCFVFLWLGMTNFYGYSSTLNSSSAIQKYIYPESTALQDTTIAIFMSFDFLITAILTFYGSLNARLIVIGLTMMALGTLGILLSCIVVEGNTGCILLYVFCAIVGSGSSISCSASFTLANGLREPVFAATVSTGGGATGVVSFVTWIILTQVILSYTKSGVRIAVIILFGMGVAMPIIAYFLYSTFVQAEWVKKYLADEPDPAILPSNTVIGYADYKYDTIIQSSGSRFLSPRLALSHEEVPQVDNSMADENYLMPMSPVRQGEVVTTNSGSNPIPAEVDQTDSSSVTHVSKRRSVKSSAVKARLLHYWRVLRRCYPAVLLSIIACFATYLVFPGVGPSRWTISAVKKDILTGVFQFADMCGRYLPVLGSLKYFTFLRPTVRNAFIFVICRLILVGTFILSQRLPTDPVVGDFWFQFLEVFLLASSTGFITTVTMISAPTFLDDDDKLGRSKANSLGVFGILLGISSGLWASKLLTL